MARLRQKSWIAWHRNCLNYIARSAKNLGRRCMMSFDFKMQVFLRFCESAMMSGHWSVTLFTCKIFCFASLKCCGCNSRNYRGIRLRCVIVMCSDLSPDFKGDRYEQIAVYRNICERVRWGRCGTRYRIKRRSRC